MLAIVSIVVIMTLSLLITRIASTALTLTGLSRESARFQARSAFTGVGFTTNEAELVVNHPVRRRILMTLMMVGNAGIVTTMASLMLTFISVESPVGWIWRLLALVVSLLILWVIATSQWVDRQLSPFITWAVNRWANVKVRDYAEVLHLAGDYAVMELNVQQEDWLSEKTLRELELPDEGVLVLGIQRPDGRYIGAPQGETRVLAGDTLILYGRSSVLTELDERPDNFAGEVSHRATATDQQQVEEEERASDQSAGVA